jgi:hypothetical protein
MFVCLFDDDTVAMVDDVNGYKVNFRGIVIDVLNFWDECQ